MKFKSTLQICLIAFSIVFFSACLSIDTIEESGISYLTLPSELPDDLLWAQIGSAKELINVRKKIVIVSGGSNPADIDEWENFRSGFPWRKNIDRNLLFDSTYFYRSPGIASDCTVCISEVEYKKHSWVKLAQIVGVTFIPEKTSILKPDEGHLVVKTIEKCQSILYLKGKEVFELSDDKGNSYIMHATEKSNPNLDVVLPEGWLLESRILEEDLVIGPFGGGDFCYYNILGDHLGQGYHQVEYSDEIFPIIE